MHGHCGGGGESEENSVRVRVDKAFSKDEGEGGWNKAIYHTVGPGGEKKREREWYEGTERSNKA